MPNFPNKDCILKKEEAINAILTSIAMEEASLSHILNAEGEKIQHFIGSFKHKEEHLDKLLEVNESVSNVIDQITDLQLILKSKLKLAKSMINTTKKKKEVHDYEHYC